MKMSLRLTSILLLAAVFTVATLSPVMAQESDVICETGAYGQTNCRQVPREKIKGIDRVETPIKTVNAGLDPVSMMAVLGLMSAGVGSAAYLTKSR